MSAQNTNGSIPEIKIFSESSIGDDYLTLVVVPDQGYLNQGDTLIIQRINEKNELFEESTHLINYIEELNDNKKKILISPFLDFNVKISDRIKKIYFPVKRVGGPTWQESNPFDVTREKKCPENKDVIIIIGQSNAANSVEILKYNKTQHLNFFEGKCYILFEDVYGATGSGGGHAHSLALPLANKLQVKDQMIFLINAVSGSSIKDWSDPTFISNYTNKEILRLQKLNNKIKYIIWIQGEQDRHTNIDYKKYFLIMKDNILKGYKEKNEIYFIVTQTSICGNQKRDTNLNQQQIELSQILKNTITLEITDNLNYRYRYDLCHFNSKGTEIITDTLAKQINILEGF